MKRKMNVILVLVLLFSAMNLASVAQASTPRISISCFEYYQIDNGTLSAQKSEMLELQSLSAAAGTGEDMGDRFYVEMKVDTFTAYQV